MIDLVILNYVNYNDTLELLRSVIRSRIDYIASIYVIDNNSNNNSLDLLKEGLSSSFSGGEVLRQDYNEGCISHYEIMTFNLKSVFLVQSIKNGGYGAGNNIGIELFLKGDSDYVLICNNDIVFPDFQLEIFLARALEVFSEDKSIGVISNILYYYHMRNHIQTSGGLLNTLNGRTKNQNSGNDCLVDMRSPDYPPGALMLLSRDVVNDVGLFSEHYFLYYEELDYVFRMKKKNYRFKVLECSKILHKEGASIGSCNNSYRSVSELSDFYLNINKLVFYKNFFPFRLPIIYIVLVANIVRRVLRLEFRKAFNIMLYILNGKVFHEKD